MKQSANNSYPHNPDMFHSAEYKYFIGQTSGLMEHSATVPRMAFFIYKSCMTETCHTLDNTLSVFINVKHVLSIGV